MRPSGPPSLLLTRLLLQEFRSWPALEAHFAAPIVAGALARDLPSPDPAAAARATARLAQAAEDLGPKGPDRLYGKGLVGFSMVVRPAEVAAKGMLTQS